jgi:protein-S-isoprenylcysteine O-methyltransferase Ste14
MRHLKLKSLAGLLNLLVLMGLALFLPAGTLQYWQAWLFLGVFGSSVLAITVYLMICDSALLERRMHVGPTAEKRAGQRISQSLASVAFLLLFVVPAVDHRFACSTMPLFFIAVGEALVALGLFGVLLVFKENSFSSAIIERSDEQSVISTGPYAIVRHPMYAGALVMLLGVPLALGSWYGLPFVFPMLVVIVWRLDDEERFLHEVLPGYPEYCLNVRYRLVPGLW